MPVTVTVKVPRESPLVPWNVRVELTLPFAGTLTGFVLNVSVTPLTLVADSNTDPLNPLMLVTVTVTDPDPVRCMERLVGEAPIEKSPGGGAVTVRAYEALCVNDPLVPVTVIVYDPVAVAAVVDMERVLVNVGLPLVGLTEAVSPVAVGEIDVVRLTN